VPFIEPWLTPHDHALAIMGHRYAEAVSGQAVRVVAANGVAEEGMIFHRLGTKFVGWSPVGKDAHEPGEYVIMETIEERAEWLSKLAQHDGDLD
jgi:acetylornithine deacetylase/succinyl-diaminopimelate desuccinylase-like protein